MGLGSAPSQAQDVRNEYPASLIQDAGDVAVFAARIKLRLAPAQHYLVDALAAHACFSADIDGVDSASQRGI